MSQPIADLYDALAVAPPRPGDDATATLAPSMRAVT